MELTTPTLKIRGKLFGGIKSIMDDPGMRAVFEDHIPWLRERAQIHQVNKHDAHRFNYDLHAYLAQNNVDYGMHWLIMRMNGYQYQWDFHEYVEFLLVPSNQDVNELIDQYAATRNVIVR